LKRGRGTGAIDESGDPRKTIGDTGALIIGEYRPVCPYGMAPYQAKTCSELLELAVHRPPRPVGGVRDGVFVEFILLGGHSPGALETLHLFGVNGRRSRRRVMWKPLRKAQHWGVGGREVGPSAVPKREGT